MSLTTYSFANPKRSTRDHASYYPPSLIPVLWNIGILLHKQANQTILTTSVLNIDFLAISSHLFCLGSAGVSKHYQNWIKITSNYKYAVLFRFPWNVHLKRMSTLLLIALEEKPSSLNYYLPPDFHIFRWPCFTNLKRHAFIAGELMIPMNGNLRKKYDTM